MTTVARKLRRRLIRLDFNSGLPRRRKKALQKFLCGRPVTARERQMTRAYFRKLSAVAKRFAEKYEAVKDDHS